MIQLNYFLKPIIALTLLVILAVVYFLAKGKGMERAAELEEYQFKLKFLAPVGFYLYNLIPICLNAEYDRKVRAKLADLYGYRDFQRHFTVHMAQKYCLVIVVVLLFSIIALAGEVDFSFLAFGLFAAGTVYYWADKDVDKRLSNKKRAILVDLPGFINALSLLINAGLPFSAAVNKVVRDEDKSRPLYKELSYVLADISSGKPTNQAYEDFAHRCRIPEITRFVSTILQNLNRGSSDLVYVLRTMAQEAWDKRKDIAKKQGEEAGAKLVIPMVMVFVAVAIIVLAPAMMTMGM